MRIPRQFITLATVCGIIPLAAWCIALGVSSLPPVQNIATPLKDRDATTVAIPLAPKTTDRVVPSAPVVASVADVPKSAADSTTPILEHVPAAAAPLIKTPVAEAPVVEA